MAGQTSLPASRPPSLPDYEGSLYLWTVIKAAIPQLIETALDILQLDARDPALQLAKTLLYPPMGKYCEFCCISVANLVILGVESLKNEIKDAVVNYIKLTLSQNWEVSAVSQILDDLLELLKGDQPRDPPRFSFPWDAGEIYFFFGDTIESLVDPIVNCAIHSEYTFIRDLAQETLQLLYQKCE
jgi:hypothetical protein